MILWCDGPPKLCHRAPSGVLAKLRSLRPPRSKGSVPKTLSAHTTPAPNFVAGGPKGGSDPTLRRTPPLFFCPPLFRLFSSSLRCLVLIARFALSHQAVYFAFAGLCPTPHKGPMAPWPLIGEEIAGFSHRRLCRLKVREHGVFGQPLRTKSVREGSEKVGAAPRVCPITGRLQRIASTLMIRFGALEHVSIFPPSS